VHDDSPLTVAPTNEDHCQLARLSPYYKDSHTPAQGMITLDHTRVLYEKSDKQVITANYTMPKENVLTNKSHTNGTCDEFHSLEGHSYIKVNTELMPMNTKSLLMNKFHSNTKIEIKVMKLKMTLF
jgi:hypothetical protein